MVVQYVLQNAQYPAYATAAEVAGPKARIGAITTALRCLVHHERGQATPEFGQVEPAVDCWQHLAPRRWVIPLVR